MTLKELIDQCRQIENHLTSCEIPLKYHGRSATLKLKLEIDKWIAWLEKQAEPNPNNYPYINHKDENPSNNHVDNLEWCTAEYNSNYGTCKERIGLTNGIPVLKYDLEGNFISEYPTMTEAERNEGIDHANICICCEGKISHCNNFIWIYKGDEHTIQDRIKKVKNSITRPKKLEMYDMDGNYIRTYDSILQASKTSGDSYMIINRQLKTGIITKNSKHIWKQV